MKIHSILFVLILFFLANSVAAQKKYLPTGISKPIVKEYKTNKFSSALSFADNIKQDGEFSIFSKIFEDSQVKEKIESEEGVTIFAITDASFSKLSKKEKQILISNRNLMNQMVYHVTIPGRIDRNSLEIAVRKNGGTASLATLQGEKLKVMAKDGKLYISDNNDNSAQLLATDFFHKNGLFHIVEGMLWLDSGK